MDLDADSLLERLGYELRGVLGGGSMGEVWRAHDLKLDRDVAIKFVKPERVGFKALERFRVEARALARIKHPNVVTVYQLGDLGEQPFLVYELVEGVSIDKLIGTLEWRRTLAIATELSRGLDAAHAVGVLHRDIKPANAMVTHDGEAKLIDFGLAKFQAEPGEEIELLAEDPGIDWEEEEQDRQAAPTANNLYGPTHVMAKESSSSATLTQAGLTQPNALLGTPRYIAPELWLGAKANETSDVYALALVVWEMLAGVRVHANATLEELRREVVHAPLPALRSLAPSLPQALAEIIDRACSKHVAERFAAAADFCAALERVAEELAAPKERGPSSSGHAGGLPASTSPVPQTRWIQAGAVSIAAQHFGEGPVDLVYIPAWVSHCEVAWRLPEYADFMSGLGKLARVTVFDKRGTGMSDRVHRAVPLEERVLDIPAILDALELESAVLFGVQDGGVLASMFAATHPQRVRGLIWYGSARRLLASPGHPQGMPPAMFAEILASIGSNWGSPMFADFAAPTRAKDPAFLSWWADYLRNGASPGTARWTLEFNATLDVDPLLPAIGVPSLIVHRRGDQMMPLSGGQSVARSIRGARWVELEGEDHLPWLSDSDALLATIASFLDDLDTLPRRSPRLCSVLVRDGEVHEFSGPVAAMEAALGLASGGPALVDVFASEVPVQAAVQGLLERLSQVTSGPVVATQRAVSLAACSGLGFEQVADDVELFVVTRAPS